MSVRLFDPRRISLAPPPITKGDLQILEQALETPLRTMEMVCKRSPTAYNTEGLALLTKVESVFNKHTMPPASPDAQQDATKPNQTAP